MGEFTWRTSHGAWSCLCLSKVCGGKQSQKVNIDRHSSHCRQRRRRQQHRRRSRTTKTPHRHALFIECIAVPYPCTPSTPDLVNIHCGARILTQRCLVSPGYGPRKTLTAAQSPIVIYQQFPNASSGQPQARSISPEPCRSRPVHFFTCPSTRTGAPTA